MARMFPKMTDDERTALREHNRKEARAYHAGRKWYAVEHLKATEQAMRRLARRTKRAEKRT